MKITLLAIGKTDKDFVKKGFEEYTKRLSKYVNFEFQVLPDVKNSKNMNEDLQKNKEGDLLKEKFKNAHVILLDENGKTYSSVGFAKFIDKQIMMGIKHLIFVIGGPYGFSDEVYKLSNGKMSISQMTFSHQMIRMIFAEQLYRAFTIIKGEPYHHQ